MSQDWWKKGDHKCYDPSTLILTVPVDCLLDLFLLFLEKHCTRKANIFEKKIMDIVELKTSLINYSKVLFDLLCLY